MDETNKSRITKSTLRAYIMIAVLGLIWVFFHYSTSPNCPVFWEGIWQQLPEHLGPGNFFYWLGSEFSSIVETLIAHVGYFFHFGWLFDGIFLMPRNLSNLTTQMSVTAILAVGM